MDKTILSSLSSHLPVVKSFIPAYLNKCFAYLLPTNGSMHIWNGISCGTPLQWVSFCGKHLINLSASDEGQDIASGGRLVPLATRTLCWTHSELHSAPTSPRTSLPQPSLYWPSSSLDLIFPESKLTDWTYPSAVAGTMLLMMLQPAARFLEPALSPCVQQTPDVERFVVETVAWKQNASLSSSPVDKITTA